MQERLENSGCEVPFRLTSYRVENSQYNPKLLLATDLEARGFSIHVENTTAQHARIFADDAAREVYSRLRVITKNDPDLTLLQDIFNNIPTPDISRITLNGEDLRRLLAFHEQRLADFEEMIAEKTEDKSLAISAKIRLKTAEKLLENRPPFSGKDARRITHRVVNTTLPQIKIKVRESNASYDEVRQVFHNSHLLWSADGQ